MSPRSNMSTGDIYNQNVKRIVGNLLYPTCTWLVTKNSYYGLTFAMLAMTIVSAPNQFAYFMNLRRTGKLSLESYKLMQYL